MTNREKAEAWVKDREKYYIRAGFIDGNWDWRTKEQITRDITELLDTNRSAPARKAAAKEVVEDATAKPAPKKKRGPAKKKAKSK